MANYNQYTQSELDFMSDLVGDEGDNSILSVSEDWGMDLNMLGEDQSEELYLESVFHSLNENLHQSSINADGYFESSLVDQISMNKSVV